MKSNFRMAFVLSGRMAGHLRIIMFYSDKIDKIQL